MTTTSRTYTVRRAAAFVGSPCAGEPSLVAAAAGSSSSPLAIVGRPLPAGTRIRVTVEVLSEPPPDAVCINPWHEEYEVPHRPEDYAAGRPLPFPAARP